MGQWMLSLQMWEGKSHSVVVGVFNPLIDALAPLYSMFCEVRLLEKFLHNNKTSLL
jgi:hypothetical protein